MTVKGEDRREVPLRVAAGTVSANFYASFNLLSTFLQWRSRRPACQ